MVLSNYSHLKHEFEREVCMYVQFLKMRQATCKA
jgi:hypothetical protein